jgi:hypothetical protein
MHLGDPRKHLAVLLGDVQRQWRVLYDFRQIGLEITHIATLE